MKRAAATLISAAAIGLAAPSATAQSLAIPPRVVAPGPLAFDRRAVPRIDPSLDLTAQAVAKLRDDLNDTRAELAQARTDIAKLRTEFEGYKELAALATNKLNALDLRFGKHTHRYTYSGVNFTTKWFVSSGRPIVESEKKDYGSVITGTPSYIGETMPPTPPK